MKKIIWAAGFCLLAACQTTTNTAQVSNSGASAIPVSGSFTTDLNAFRASQGRNGVQPSAALTRAAERHARDMVARGYFSHDSPGGPNGGNLTERLVSGGCRTRAGAENIAEGQTSESAVLVAWQNSSGHRRNMLGERYTQYGLGRAGNTWVLLFSSGC